MTNKRINHSRPMFYVDGSNYLMLLLLLQTSIAEAQSSNSGGSTPPNHHGSNRRFTPSMAIIIVVLISAFFLMAFFSVYLRLCAGDTRSGGSRRRSGMRNRSRRAARRGLDPAVIETFPTFEYSAVKGLKLGKDALECAVCINEFEDEETLRLLPKCSHVFHTDCIDAWLASHTTCPVCRSNLVPTADTNVPPAETPDPGTVYEDETRDEVPLHQVAVDISDDRNEDLQPDAINRSPLPIPIPIQNRPIRSKSTRRPLRFPRSHSTGHSLVQPGENVERFTLRLPEHVRKEIVDGSLNRSASCTAFRTEGESVSGGSNQPRVSKIGEVGEEEGGRGRFQWRYDRASKSDRWAFLTAPSFFLRTFSVRSQKRAEGEQPQQNQKGILPSVKTTFDCLGGKAEATAEQTAAHGSGPVFTVSTE